jgi:hypothetical protein
VGLRNLFSSVDIIVQWFVPLEPSRASTKSRAFVTGKEISQPSSPVYPHLENEVPYVGREVFGLVWFLNTDRYRYLPCYSAFWDSSYGSHCTAHKR